MVVDVPPRNLLQQRRLVVRNYWRDDRTKRKAALNRGFADALETSTTAITEFELGDRDEFPNGKGVYDYIRYLETLERAVEKDKARKAGKSSAK